MASDGTCGLSQRLMAACDTLSWLLCVGYTVVEVVVVCGGRLVLFSRAARPAAAAHGRPECRERCVVPPLRCVCCVAATRVRPPPPSSLADHHTQAGGRWGECGGRSSAHTSVCVSACAGAPRVRHNTHRRTGATRPLAQSGSPLHNRMPAHPRTTAATTATIVGGGEVAEVVVESAIDDGAMHMARA